MKRIQQILDRHKLRLVEILRSPDGGLRRSWIILVENTRKKRLVLKVFDSNDVYARKRFIDEVRNVRLIRESVGFVHKKLFPAIVHEKITDDELYYSYGYFAGIPLGTYTEDFGIALGRFNKENFPVFVKVLTIIADFNMIKGGVARVYDIDRAQKEFESYESVYNSYGLGTGEKLDIQKFLYSVSGDVFHRENMTVCQTDLYPANILVDRAGGKVFKFLDWEYLALAPIGFLPAFIYLMFWKEEFWRAKIYSHFYNYYVNEKGFKESIFNNSFRFCVVILGLRFWYQTHELSANGIVEERRLSGMATFNYFVESAVKGDIVKPSNLKFYINKADLQKVADIYKLGEVIKYNIYYSGRGNTVAKVVTEDRSDYIFRFYYKTRTSKMISNELDLYDKLSSAGIPTYKVFRSPDGNLFSTVKLYGRIRRIAVLSYLPGSRISRKWDSVRTTRTLGSTLSKIHSLGVVHNDYSKENILFVKGKLTGVIDFEWGKHVSGRSAYEDDVAKAIALWLIDVRGKNVVGDIFIYEFLLGYYGGSLPSKQILRRLTLKIEKKLAREQRIAENIFYKHSSPRTRQKGIQRFIYARSDLDKFRKNYIG